MVLISYARSMYWRWDHDLELRRFLVRAAFLAARERAAFDGRPTGPVGTRLPSRRASDSAIAIACLRLLTVPPFPPLPLFKVPRLNLRISRSTSFEAPREYFLAMTNPPFTFGSAAILPAYHGGYDCS